VKYTPTQIDQLVTESRRKQGLPPRVNDSGTIRKVADLIASAIQPTKTQSRRDTKRSA
jgi:hypothetical protein